MRVTKLDWQVTATMERIIADMTFENFDQSMRFMNTLTDFIRGEKALAQASHAPEAPAGKYEAPVQGEVQSEPQAPSGPDGQHPEQTDTGSVT